MNQKLIMASRKICPHCGFDDNRASYAKCWSCDKPLDNVPVVYERPIAESITVVPKPEVTTVERCPYCKSEIESNALKCKNCGEWLNTTQQREAEQEERTNNWWRRIGNIIRGCALFYLGGWSFIEFSAESLTKYGYTEAKMIKEWGGSLLSSWDTLLLGTRPSVMYGAHSFMIDIDGKFYGILCHKRLFDAPFLQWIFLIGALWLILDGLFDIKGYFRR